MIQLKQKSSIQPLSVNHFLCLANVDLVLVKLKSNDADSLAKHVKVERVNQISENS